MALIWALSSIGGRDLSVHLPVSDKVVHCAEYAVLGFLLAHAALSTWPRHSIVRAAALALLITVAWGVLDEVHQAFVPGRDADVFDLVADVLGGLIGTSLRAAVRRFRAASRTASTP